METLISNFNVINSEFDRFSQLFGYHVTYESDEGDIFISNIEDDINILSLFRFGE